MIITSLSAGRAAEDPSIYPSLLEMPPEAARPALNEVMIMAADHAMYDDYAVHALETLSELAGLAR